MPIQFDHRGFLQPALPIEVSMAEVYQNFVEPFPSDSSRKRLFDTFLRYKNELTVTFGSCRQWIDGSFVSKVVSPRDIDVVTFIHYQVGSLNSSEWKRLGRHAKTKFPGIDAYLVLVYPKPHPKHALYVSDQTYWLSQFTRTRKNRRGIRLPKGCLQLMQ